MKQKKMKQAITLTNESFYNIFIVLQSTPNRAIHISMV